MQMYENNYNKRARVSYTLGFSEVQDPYLGFSFATMNSERILNSSCGVTINSELGMIQYAKV